MHGTRRASTLDRLVSAVLTVTLVGYCLPAGAFASTERPPAAEIEGNVLAADGLTAVPGVSVKAAHMATRTIYASATTDEKGHYSLKGLPSGQYDLAVETSEGMYPANVFVNAQPGTRAVVSLALTPADEDEGEEGEEGEEGDEDSGEGDEQGEGQGQGEGQEPPEPTAETTQKKKGGGFWAWLRTPVGAAVAIGFGALGLGVAANALADDSEGDDDQFMTTSTP